MNAVFYVSAFLMLLVAMSFATAPLFLKAKSASGSFAYVPMLAAVAASLLAVGLYAAIGRPDITSSANNFNSLPPKLASSSAGSGRKAASVTELLDGLEQRLHDDPDDARGWLLLAKSYDHLGRSRDAAAAYGQAAALGLTDDALEARLK